MTFRQSQFFKTIPALFSFGNRFATSVMQVAYINLQHKLLQKAKDGHSRNMKMFIIF
jgi:hypothetical protein